MHEASGWEIWRDCCRGWQVCVHWCVNRWVKCIGQIYRDYQVCVQIGLILFILSFIHHDGPLLPPLTGKAPHEHPPIFLNPIEKQSTKRHLPPGAWHVICWLDIALGQLQNALSSSISSQYEMDLGGGLEGRFPWHSTLFHPWSSQEGKLQPILIH